MKVVDMGNVKCLLSFAAFTLAAPAGALAEEPLRIVSIGAEVTETLVELGAEKQIVGVDATSRGIVEGPAQLGFYKRISAEGLLSLRPNLILARHDAGFPATFDQVQSAGIKVVRLPKVDSPAAAVRQVETVASAVGRSEKGAVLIQKIEETLSMLEGTRTGENDKPKVLFVYARGAGALLVGGRKTTADIMINLVGASNAADAVAGYKPLSPEFLLAHPPEILLLATHGFNALGGLEGIRAHPALSRTPAVRRGAVIVRDAEDLLSFGPRFAERAVALAALIDHKLAPFN